MPSLTLKFSRKFWMLTAALIILVSAILPILFYGSHPLAPGTDRTGRPLHIAPEQVNLLIDSTAFDPVTGKRVIRQVIFDEVLAMIKRADRFIYLDMFLWNPWQGTIPEDHRAVSTELAEALIRKKRANPRLDILVLTDPINRIYGQMEPAFFRNMEQAGIPIVFTSLENLPDSNWLYGRYWQFYHRVFSTVPLLERLVTKPLFPNPFIVKGPKISTRQWGRLFLFKANHRKVVVTGSQQGGLELLVGSFNPADGSSAHSNLALRVTGPVALHALGSELDLARWSAGQPGTVLGDQTGNAHRVISRISSLAAALKNRHPADASPGTVQWLSEQAISRTMVEMIGKTEPGDEIRMAVFYLSDRNVVKALKKTVKKGASARIIIDANKDAFGMKKMGIPNRQAAAELMKLSPRHDVQVRWADTHGEQFHTKAMTVSNEDTGKYALLAGSANWTRRNLQNLNLEANLLVADEPGTVGDFNRYFDKAWSNSGGLSYTLPFEAWSEDGFTLFWKTVLYRFQEWSGMGTF